MEAGEHRREVREDVAEHVGGHDHVELLGVAHELHRRVVHVHVAELHVLVLLAHALRHLAPQLAHLEDVGLVHRAHAAGPSARGFERGPADALDLGLGVDERVDSPALAALHGLDAPRGAEVDAPGELAHDEDIEAGHHVGAQGGRVRELRIEDRGTKIREEPEPGPQPEQSPLGAEVAVEGVPSRPADGPHEHRVGRLGARERLVGKRLSGRLVGRAAEQTLLDLGIEVGDLRHPSEDPESGRDHLRPDAVARQREDVGAIGARAGAHAVSRDETMSGKESSTGKDSQKTLPPIPARPPSGRSPTAHAAPATLFAPFGHETRFTSRPWARGRHCQTP